MMLESLFDDVRIAVRGLRRAKALTAAAVLTLAVGIAGTAVMFALVEGVLIRPMPVAEQDRLLVAWKEVRGPGGGHWPFELEDIETIGRESRLLRAVAGVGYNGAPPGVVVENGAASYVNIAAVTGDVFRVLGVTPVLGRALDRRDDAKGAERVLVITHALWQNRYGGAPDVIGRALTVDEREFRIVGVMPPDVEFPRGVQAWLTVGAEASMLRNPAFRIHVDLLARMRPGVTLEQARSELQAIAERLNAKATPPAPREMRLTARRLDELVVGDVKPAMLLLFGAVGIVLLVACANVANLLLLRGEARRAELAVHAALGASHGRLTRQLLAESAILAAPAGIIGLAATGILLPVLVGQVPGGLPRADAVRVDAAVVLFTTLIGFATAMMAGLLPALASARADVAARLKGAARGETTRVARHGRRALVAVQVGLAVTVVAGAGLLIRSLVRLQTIDTGLAADRLVFVELQLPHEKYAERERHLQFLKDAVRELEAAGPIVAATPIGAEPFAGTAGWDALFTGEGQSAERATENPLLNFEAIYDGYFETAGVRIVRGRAFNESDRKGAPLVAIVSEDVAARTWPGQDPIGRRIKIGGLNSDQPWRVVVGVAARTRYRELREPRPTLYLPAEQFIVASQRLALRTASPVNLVASVARERLRAVDPDVQVVRVASFTELLERPLARPRFSAFLIALFAGVALLLAAVGLYAVVAASVRQREAEIGLRVALGATASDVRRLVVGEGLQLAAAGAVIGLAAAVAGSRLLAGLLFEVHPLDPLSMGGAALLLVTVSAAASWLPARRATRVDPIVTLRTN